MSVKLDMRGSTLRAEVSRNSPLRAYQDVIVGSRSLPDLLRYELLASWGSAVPGAAGMVLRKWLWRGLVGTAGGGVVWGRGIVLRHPRKMRIGGGVLLDDGCFLDAKGCAAGEFEIGAEAMISRECILSAKEGPIRLGERANLGARCCLYSSGGIEIGRDTLLAAQCYVGGGSYDHRGRTDMPMSRQPLRGRGVVIGEDCWLGAGVTVTDGVRIGRGSVVGAGAVVVSDIPPWSVAVGVPARVIGERERAAAEVGC